MTKKIKILLHYTHKETLGHTTRVNALCHTFNTYYKQKVSIYALQGGIPQPFVKFPPNTQLLDVPAPFDSRNSFKNSYPEKKNLLRASFILNASRKIKPDAFITEFFPFGQIEYLSELLAALRYLRQRKTKIYASIGYPYLINHYQLHEKEFRHKLYSIVELYDKFFIHTPEGLENPYFQDCISNTENKKYHAEFFAKIADRTIYTGYILPIQKRPSARTKNILNTKKITIIVSRGGGAVSPKIISDAIKTALILGKKYQFLIATGPSTTTSEQNLFKAYLKKNHLKNIFLTKHIPNLSYYLRSCDVSVSMCGYGTSVQILHAGIPSIIIPYQNTDQLARSMLLKDLIKSKILPYEEITPLSLANAIKEKHKKTPSSSPFPQEWFNGARATADHIMLKEHYPQIS